MVITSTNMGIQLITRVLFIPLSELVPNLEGDLTIIFYQEQFVIMVGSLLHHRDRVQRNRFKIIYEVGNWGSTTLVTRFKFVNDNHQQ